MARIRPEKSLLGADPSRKVTFGRGSVQKNNFLAQIPIKFPNFAVNVLNVTAEADRVHVHLHYTADNLDAQSVHMFVVKDGLETEFHVFDDSQKMAMALNG